MAKKRTDYPNFSNEAEKMEWLGRNCNRCIKAEHPIVKYKTIIGYANLGLCRVNQEILYSTPNGGVTRRVSKIIHGSSCPFIKTDWPKRGKNPKQDIEPKLFEDEE